MIVIIGAGVAGLSMGWELVRAGAPVTIFRVQVNDGDLVNADRHGALVVPEAVIDGLADAIGKLLETEKLVLNPARQPGFDIDAFEAAWAAFEAART